MKREIHNFTEGYLGATLGGKSKRHDKGKRRHNCPVQLTLLFCIYKYEKDTVSREIHRGVPWWKKQKA